MTDSLSKKTDQLTQGTVIRSLLTLAGPIVFANILQTAYQLIDTFWVGRLGADAVASVSVSFPFLFLLIALGGGLTIAGSIFVAQYAGAKNYLMVNHSAGQTLSLIVLISTSLSVVGYWLAPMGLKMMNVEPAIFDSALIYLRISFLGIVFSFTFMVFQSILRGVGEVKFPLYVISFTVLVNAILDPVLIFGWGPVPGYGVAGAAYATIATQAVGGIVGVIALSTGKYGVSLCLKDYIPEWSFMKRALFMGIPASIEQSTRSLGMIFMTFLVSGFGTLGLATMGMGMRIISLIIIPAMGLSMATSTIVGQNIGAGNFQRADEVSRLSAKLGFWMLSGLGVLFFVFAPSIIRVFVPGDEVLIAASAIYIQIAAPTFGFMAAEQALMGTLRGAGDMKGAMLIALGTQWVFQYPLSYVLSQHTALGMEGLWWGFPASTFLAFVVTYWWFNKGKWKEIRLTKHQEFANHVTDEIISEEAIP